MSEKITKDYLLKCLADCASFPRDPDLHQYMHNLLLRNLAAYLLDDEIEKLESNDE